MFQTTNQMSLSENEAYAIRSIFACYMANELGISKWYGDGHLSVLSTYNPIYRMYNPIYNQL